MIDIKFFIPIKKVDEEKRLVYGVAIAEEVDNANEIFDYESSKPNIEAWSNEFKKNTEGKSLGNLRAMHEPVSAGKIVELNFSDNEKKVNVCAKVIDDKEWEKVLQGVYTGFSFGGHAINRWKDEKTKAYRYTLIPSELSLADKPCVPSAVFEVIKTDGSSEKRGFKKILGGTKTMLKIEKNMDMTQFLELMQNVQAGFTEEDPKDLVSAVDNLVSVLKGCTGTQETSPEEEEKIEDPKEDEESKEKDVKSGCMTEKVDIGKEIQKVLSPLTKTISGLSDLGENVKKMSQNMEALQKRVSKIESQPAPVKIVKTIPKTEDAEKVESTIEEIKKAHNFQTCAY